MKMLVTILTLLLAAQAAFGVVVLPSAAGTNDLAASRASQQIRETSQRFFTSGQFVEIQRQMDRIEVEVFALAVGGGGIGVALILLLSRDRLRETRHAQENHAANPHANK